LCDQQSATRPQDDVSAKKNGNERQRYGKKEQSSRTRESSQWFGLSRPLITQQGSANLHDQKEVRRVQRQTQGNATCYAGLSKQP